MILPVVGRPVAVAVVGPGCHQLEFDLNYYNNSNNYYCYNRRLGGFVAFDDHVIGYVVVADEFEVAVEVADVAVDYDAVDSSDAVEYANDYGICVFVIAIAVIG